MSILDKVGRIARRAGTAVTETVGGLVDDALLSDEGRRAYSRAEAAIAHGQWEDALAELDKVEASRPGLMRTALLRGVAWLELDRETRGIHFLEKAISIRESIEGYYFLGLAYERAERLTDARNALLAAAQQERDPELAFDMLFALGRVYLAMHRADKAVRELERALATRPGDQPCVTLLAAALRRHGEDERAIALLEEHRDRLNGPEPWVLLGQLYLAREQHLDASAAFSRALEHEERVDALEGEAVAAWGAGDPDTAKERYRAARRLGGDSSSLRTLAGHLALHDGDPELAVEHFLGALDLSTHAVEALVGLGEAWLAQDDHGAAADSFSRALVHEPDNRNALIGAGLARLGLGDRAAALRLLDQARAEGADHRVFAALADLAEAGEDHLEAIVLLREAISLAPAGKADALETRLSALEAQRNESVPRPRALKEREITDLDPTELAPWVRDLRNHVATVPLAREKTVELGTVLDELDAPLKVAVLGEFNAGKSTLVNAWLGEPVVATGVLPTTAHLNVIRYGPRRVAHIVTVETDGTEKRAEYPWSELSAAVEKAEGIDHLEYFYPHPELRALHFVDTPGFNAAVDGHTEIASRMLTDADAVLWIVDTNQALSASQHELLASIPGARHKVLVVLNKVDGLDDEDVQEVLDYLERNVGEVVRGIVPLSALEAFKARNTARESGVSPSDEALEAARWPGFERLLADEIMDRSSQLKVLEAVRHLDELADEIDELAAKNAKRLELLAEQMSAGAESLGKARDGLLNRELIDALERFGDQRRIALATVAREAGDARRPLGGWLSELGLGQDDLSFVLSLLEERIARALEQTRLDVLDAVKEPVEAALATLEWIAGALASDQAQALFARLSAFVTEDRMLRIRLEEKVVGWHQAQLHGRIAAASADVDLAARLGDEDADDQERQRILSGVLGQPSERLQADLRAWTGEYFAAALRLCDNVRRDIERLRLEVEHELLAPFGAVKEITGRTPAIEEKNDVDA